MGSRRIVRIAGPLGGLALGILVGILSAGVHVPGPADAPEGTAEVWLYGRPIRAETYTAATRAEVFDTLLYRTWVPALIAAHAVVGLALGWLAVRWSAGGAGTRLAPTR
jgi:hypothetical protein